MERQILRSWRDPRFWLPLTGALGIALAVALLGRLWLLHPLEKLELLRASDPEAAAVAARRGLRVLGWGTCAFAWASAALLARYFQLGLREQRLPPSGWWSLGALRAVVGPQARTRSRFGLGLCGVLAAAGVGCVFAVERLIAVL
jgi:hypothetical protein